MVRNKFVLPLILAFVLNGPALSCDVETVITPYEVGVQRYVSFVREHCHKSLHVADYAFTSQPVADMYCDLASKGIPVRVILDRSMSKSKNTKPLIQKMQDSGVEVIITTSPVRGSIMHSKFTVVDQLWVEDGSWNYTPNADQQINTLNFSKSACPERAQVFMRAWELLYTYAISRNK